MAFTGNKEGKVVRIAGLNPDKTGKKAIDDLTGLPNLIPFLDHLTRSLETTKKHGSNNFAVLIVDLELPKNVVNHPESEDRDLLLVTTARRLETWLTAAGINSPPRHDHLVARLEGEGFVILINALNDTRESKAIADRLLKEISVPIRANGREVQISANIGIAISTTGYQTAEEVLRDADTALYRSKLLGTGGYEVFDTAILKSVKGSGKLETDLQRAIERQEFSVFYQPIVSLSSHRIAGFEALLRWEHPVYGLIPPGEFIPVAEKTRLIIPLGHWVIREACRQLKSWKGKPGVPKDLWVSINLSSVQFKYALLAKDIRKILSEVGTNANGLVFELTEGEVVEDPEAAIRILMQLRATGARIALDDFGTGYSSLAYLCRLPLDYLKIDQSFVNNIETSKDEMEIIRTINSLAFQFGLRVIAEGIENLGQLDLVSALNCDYGQGFLFSKAVSKDKVESLFKKEFVSTKVEHEEGKVIDEGNVENMATHYENSIPESVNPDLNQIGTKKKQRILRANHASILIGSATIIFLFAAGILVRIKPSIPNQAAISENIKPESVPEAPKQPKIKKTSPVYELPVIHDHLIGSCTGILKITNDTLSYTSKHEKCNFSLHYNEIDFSLDGKRLEIKTESQKYHFELNNSSAENENSSQIQEIYRRISKYKH